METGTQEAVSSAHRTEGTMSREAMAASNPTRRGESNGTPVAAVALLSLLAGLAWRAEAATFVVGSDADLLAASEVVVLGRVESSRSVERGGGVETLAEVKVSRRVVGHTADYVTVRLPGGESEGRQQVVYGAPELSTGEKVLLFLRPRGDGTFAVTQLAMGKYRVVGSGREALAVRDLQGAEVLRGRRDGLVRRSPQEVRRLADLERSLRQGGTEEYSEVVPVPPPPVSQSFRGAFRMLGSRPARWNEPDEGRAIVYVVEESAAAATGLDVAWAVAQATAAWSNVGCANLILESSRGGEPAPFDACDGRSQVLFGDPFNEVDAPEGCSGVLGVGGYCAVGDLREVGDVAYRRITEGNVVMNDGFERCPFWSDLNLSEMLAHEIGHTLGLGHSSENRNEPDPKLNDALMYYRAHFDGRGAAVMEDDERGLCAVYPRPEVADDDDDEVSNATDNCPAVANPRQADTDGDGEGDACDALTLERAMLGYDERRGVLDTHLKLSGVLRPARRLNPGRDTLVLHLRAGEATALYMQVPAGAWSLNEGVSHMTARLRGAAGVESIALYRQEDGTYRFRVRSRSAHMLDASAGGLTLDLTMGGFSAGSPLPLRPRSASKLVFP